MGSSKAVNTPRASHFKLSSNQSPSSEYEAFDMKCVSYVSVVGSLMYLPGTTSVRFCFGGDKPTIVGYFDSNMAGDINSRKSTSGYTIKFAGEVVTWQYIFQKCISQSVTEAESLQLPKHENSYYG
ncbi:hypothetical protein KIW84_072791 [Lathyrus oleraceus]|uniref:Gag-pol polyprotein n=1 Tax=Pisum sativum TaxID=3888 RepID=A0A9D4VMS8_PEA|nr:hypothetical protein KIW84_072791 [Pisum sativum]